MIVISDFALAVNTRVYVTQTIALVMDLFDKHTCITRLRALGFSPRLHEYRARLMTEDRMARDRHTAPPTELTSVTAELRLDMKIDRLIRGNLLQLEPPLTGHQEILRNYRSFHVKYPLFTQVVTGESNSEETHSGAKISPRVVRL